MFDKAKLYAYRPAANGLVEDERLFVADVTVPSFTYPSPVIVWGSRCFVHALTIGEYEGRPKYHVYYERFMYVIPPGESFDGTPETSS